MTSVTGFFNGSVEDAIKKVKQQGTCLLVFVHGDDEISKKYDGYFSSQGRLSQTVSQFVSMRLSGQSDTALQFSAYYPVVSLPTIYLIGADGVSLEALIGDRTEDDLADRISAAAAAVSVASAGAGAAGAAAAGAASSASDPPEWDARVEQMERKIEERQAEKQREAAEREKLAEVERRSVGRSLAQLRQEQLLEEEKARAEEVRQERQARMRARQQPQQQLPQAAPEPEPADEAGSRIRDLRAAQSAAYHEERLAAQAARADERASIEAAEAAAAAAAEAERRQIARLQIRCPDGRVFVREMPASATLAELRASVPEGYSGAGPFRLSTVYPRRVFEDSESSRTLGELELAPSASLLLLPGRPGAATGGGGGGGNTVAAVLTAPFALLGRLLALLFGLLTALFGGGGGIRQGADAAAPAMPPASTGSQRRPPGARGGGGGGATVQRSGNTARLRNIPGSGQGPDGADDDGATWNGNSTQQM